MGGGQGGETWFSTVLRYDADDQKWFEVSCGSQVFEGQADSYGLLGNADRL